MRKVSQFHWSAPGPRSVSKPFPWWIYIASALLIAILIVWPLASVIFTSSIAEAYGCAFDGPVAQPCLVKNEDWGQVLHTLSRIGWFLLTTIPIGPIALVIWGLVLYFHRQSYGKSLSTSP